MENHIFVLYFFHNIYLLAFFYLYFIYLDSKKYIVSMF